MQSMTERGLFGSPCVLLLCSHTILKSNHNKKILCFASLRHDFAQDDIGLFAVILSGDANAS